MAYNNIELIVAVVDPRTGLSIAQQPFDEFKRGSRSTQILRLFIGDSLFNIIADELGVIRFEENKAVLKTFLELDPNRTTMKLLGKIAEAVIVRRCREDEIANRDWMRIALRKKIQEDNQ